MRRVLRHAPCVPARPRGHATRSGGNSLRTVLIIILIILLLGALPTWPYSGGWGYYPSSGLGIVLLIIIILLVMGRI